MAKKFKKLLLLGAAIGSAVGAAYYFKQKKDAQDNDLAEDDYDDFSDDQETDSESSRSYVPLNPENAPETESAEDTSKTSSEQTHSETSEDDIPTGQSMFQEFAAADNFFEETSSAAESSPKEDSFTPLTEQATNAAGNAEESVEEFFDEEDAPGVEPPIHDN